MKIEKISLHKNWRLKNCEKKIDFATEIPQSVFQLLIKHQVIEDPFIGINEEKMEWVFSSNWSFENDFEIPTSFFQHREIRLKFYGLDTFTSIYLNEKLILETSNMHREYEITIKSPQQTICKIGKNHIKILFHSPTKKAQEEIDRNNRNIQLGPFALPGVHYLRKAPYSFGWDWGPKLPDIAIWKPIELVGLDTVAIKHCEVLQHFNNPSTKEKLKDSSVTNKQSYFSKVHMTIKVELEEIWGNYLQESNFHLQINLEGPENYRYSNEIPCTTLIEEHQIMVNDPHLWWIHELGQPELYQLTIFLKNEQETLDHITQNIGIREIKLIRTPDSWGESFYFEINRIPIFAKGANWIPIDSFIPRGEQLGLYEKRIADAKAANMNMLRVWGGGIYENNKFYDLCDMNGILVWQDFSFACMPNPSNDEFFENVKEEAIQNIIRLRNHPSLAIWVGNNEIEEGWVYWGFKVRFPNLKQAYFDMFEKLLPKIVADYDPLREYWPSSPSSGGRMEKPTDPNKGDSHFWKVWHGSAPFSAYKTHFSRFMSEFGFESFPDMKTISQFATPSDYNMYSPVMENHQKNKAGNKKIMTYMKRRFSVPKDFEKQVILSQITQAEAIEYGVEHWRRNRNRYHCMGTLYWQFNDCWPVASWASVDYYGRWKALHYYAKRFFNPILCSIDENKNRIQIWGINDLPKSTKALLNWKFINSKGQILKQGEKTVELEPLHSTLLEEIDIHTQTRLGKFKNLAIIYELQNLQDTEEMHNISKKFSRGIRLLGHPKYFKLKKPNLTWKIIELQGTHCKILINSKELALFVNIQSQTRDFIASDNYFHLDKDEEIEITLDFQDNLNKGQILSEMKIQCLIDLHK